ncbi:CDP-alcohol phosphatidyltransferase family protein [Henriciella mobilis]|uniref:CDP-alcohol phosphatidyltransferase family protein n=1 Tax=Henriciella mobilis TaxID=2305467 RepID=UPI000E6663D4|nr:CDP-alcohol phosphatidyltransferase family protein [Henriciella mobilis]RIJ17495.1 CDP-alcohol phosphatidyltransferase family protein [Henriciella mobilis]RIJ25517.1 CDP-alcohol phosphatidyltransferase family protein [Henriciella mobilis]
MSLKWLPNAVTVLRCVLAIIVGYAILDTHKDALAGREYGVWLFLPFALFVITAATDWLDGVLARRLDAESSFGARLDPIADKLLAASSLLALSHLEHWAWYLMLPTVAIVGRDFMMTAMREALGNPPGLNVSKAAKWKTAIVLTAIGLVLFSMAASYFAYDADPYSIAWLASRGPLLLGLLGIWVAAILSVITAIDYVQASS